MIRADRIWATSFFKTGVWGMTVTGVAAAPTPGTQFLSWADDASSPLSDIEDWKELIRAATGMEPNTLVLGSNVRSEEHTSELQSLMRISYAVFCLKKKNKHRSKTTVCS